MAYNQSMPMARVGRGNWITKVEFHSRLARWYRQGSDPVVGDPNADRRTAWIWIRDGHRLARLFSDTTREAVGEYLALVAALPAGVDWHVVRSSTGQMTKVAFGPDRVTVDGFHLYIDPRTIPSERKTSRRERARDAQSR
jgi:hypothetical protein